MMMIDDDISHVQMMYDDSGGGGRLVIIIIIAILLIMETMTMALTLFSVELRYDCRSHWGVQSQQEVSSEIGWC